MKINHTVKAVSVVLMTGCVTNPGRDDYTEKKIANSPHIQDVTDPQAIDSPADSLETKDDMIVDFSYETDEEVIQAEKEEDAELNASLNLADHEQKEEVQKWIRYFAENNRSQFEHFLQRGSYYRKVIKSILRKQKVPTYLYYLAMIESGFNSQAKSHASAVGVWQFMAPTARRYGLKVDKTIDERIDPIRSTLAASEYLKDLYNVFQSWPLAMAAYNAGEMRIVGSIMKQKSRDFWDLARRGKLPKETSHYIPKFIAAALIGNHPEKYGFTLNKATPMEPMKAVAFPSQVRLNDIAQMTGLSLQKIRHLNPHLKEDSTPNFKNYRIWLPEEVMITSQQMASLPVHKSYSASTAAHTPSSSGQNKSYRVKRGDNLAKIAKKFQISVADLKKMNGIKSTRLQVGQVLKVDV